MLVIGGWGRPILLAAALQLSDRHTKVSPSLYQTDCGNPPRQSAETRPARIASLSALVAAIRSHEVGHVLLWG